MLRKRRRELYVDTKETTELGCECKETWVVFGHVPCETSCCSPDGDEKLWCVTVEEGCDISWDYCKNQSLPRYEIIDEVSFFVVDEVEPEPKTDEDQVLEPSSGTDTTFIMIALFLFISFAIGLFTVNKHQQLKHAKIRSKKDKKDLEQASNSDVQVEASTSNEANDINFIIETIKEDIAKSVDEKEPKQNQNTSDVVEPDVVMEISNEAPPKESSAGKETHSEVEVEVVNHENKPANGAKEHEQIPEGILLDSSTSPSK